MKFTNKHELPEFLVKYLLTDDYDYEPGVMSATGLLKPLRARILQERHDNEISMDVADLANLRLGSAVHSSFENVAYDPKKIRQEERHYTEVNGQRISGKFDMLERIGETDIWQLRDIKTSSVWKYVHLNDDSDRTVREWKIQLSIYRFILVKNDISILGIGEVLMVIKDWKYSEALSNSKKETGRYTKLPYHIKKLELLDLETIRLWIASRLEALKEAREVSDDDLPRCNDEEIWKSPDKYAHWNRGNQKASKVFDSAKIDNAKEECLKAVAAAKEKGKDAFMEYRPSEAKRCRQYCPAHDFCNQYHELKEQGSIIEGEL